MTAHDHRTLVPGCYRCELDKDEATRPYVAYAIGGAYNRGFAFEAITDLPAMQPGDSVRVTMTDDGDFDVVPLVQSAAAKDAWGAEMWVDAPGQENDR